MNGTKSISEAVPLHRDIHVHTCMYSVCTCLYIHVHCTCTCILHSWYSTCTCTCTCVSRACPRVLSLERADLSPVVCRLLCGHPHSGWSSAPQAVDVRFIEYMPFDGNRWNYSKFVPYRKMLSTIMSKYPMLERLTDRPNDTSKVAYMYLYRRIRIIRP